MFSALSCLWKVFIRFFVVLDKSVKIIENEIDVLSEEQKMRLEEAKTRVVLLPSAEES